MFAFVSFLASLSCVCTLRRSRQRVCFVSSRDRTTGYQDTIRARTRARTCVCVYVCVCMCMCVCFSCPSLGMRPFRTTLSCCFLFVCVSVCLKAQGHLSSRLPSAWGGTEHPCPPCDLLAAQSHLAASLLHQQRRNVRILDIAHISSQQK